MYGGRSSSSTAMAYVKGTTDQCDRPGGLVIGDNWRDLVHPMLHVAQHARVWAPRGSLHIINHTGADGAVKLVDATTRRVERFVYVRAGEDATVRGIGEGVYRVMFTQGRDWDPYAMRFQQQPSFAEFEDRLDFSHRRTGDGVTYSKYELTLHQVLDGNARTRDIGSKDF